MTEDLTRPIIGIENRTPQEVFDIMCDRIRGTRALSPSPDRQAIENEMALLLGDGVCEMEPHVEQEWSRKVLAILRKRRAALPTPPTEEKP